MKNKKIKMIQIIVIIIFIISALPTLSTTAPAILSAISNFPRTYNTLKETMLKDELIKNY